MESKELIMHTILGQGLSSIERSNAYTLLGVLVGLLIVCVVVATPCLGSSTPGLIGLG